MQRPLVHDTEKLKNHHKRHIFTQRKPLFRVWSIPSISVSIMLGDGVNVKVIQIFVIKGSH
jgi:hypothetical protein